MECQKIIIKNWSKIVNKKRPILKLDIIKESEIFSWDIKTDSLLSEISYIFLVPSGKTIEKLSSPIFLTNISFSPDILIVCNSLCCCPKKLDEEVASLMVEGFGGTITKLTKEQADYIHVPQDGPFKEEEYKY